MNMTHYMELLAVNQLWNLLIFITKSGSVAPVFLSGEGMPSAARVISPVSESTKVTND